MENDVLVRFYRAYSREIYLYLYGLSHNRQLSEDLMQETFVKALLSLQTADTGVKAWLYKVARNLYFNTYRKDKRLVMGLDNTENEVDLKEETIKANSRFFDEDINLVPKQAMTMGIKDIMRAKHIILLAFGKEKREAIRSLVEGEEITENIPCTILKNHPSVYVLVDKEADFK